MSTKKLAKELGFLRKRSQSTGNKPSRVCNQIFSYLIVIDFESTCWREKNNYGQEIVEFPAVLLNSSTGDIESEFHTYVQPQEHPLLSEFCTELTGITQGQVEAGVPLQICLSRFNRWLLTLQLQKGLAFPGERPTSMSPAPQKPCAFVTWSDWDLAVCLQYECKRKQLHKPDVLNSWIDLRATYRLFYSRKPKGLNGALQDLGIQFSGREHSGLDDSRNTAQLALRMMRDGCVMKLTRIQERAPMTFKPLFANAPAANQRGKENMAPDEKTVPREETSSRSLGRSLQIKTCSENSVPLSFTKRNGNSISEPFQEYKSLVSPRTLLNGRATPLLGQRTAVGRQTTTVDLFSPVLVNAPFRRHNGRGLVPCSTPLGRTSQRPEVRLPFEPQAALHGYTEDHMETDIAVETEEWHGCYDDVVLNGDDEDVPCDLYELLDPEDTTSENGKCSVANGSKYVNSSILVPHQINVMSNDNSAKNVGVVMKRNAQKLEAISSSHTKRKPAWVPVNEMRPPHHASSVCKSAVPSCSTTSNHPKLLSTNIRLQVHDNSNPLQRNSPSLSSSLITPKARVHQRATVPHVFTKSSTGVLQRDASGTWLQNPKGKVGSSVHSNAANTPHPISFHPPRTPQTAIPSLSRNQMPWPPRLSAPPRVTAPLCGCGRRAKRQTVCNGGPNQGLGFYCCPVRRSGAGTRIQNGCTFFKWESALMKGHSPAGPSVQSSMSLHVLRPPKCLSISRKSY